MRISRFSALCLSAITVACAKAADNTVDSAAGASAMTPAATTPAPAAVSLADAAGKWHVRATPQEGKDSSVTEYVLTATADSSGWTITFPGRKPIAVHVRTAGDSIIALAGPYPSVRRKGVQVNTESVFRVQSGKLTGTTIARYNTKGADSVLHLRTEGTKAP